MMNWDDDNCTQRLWARDASLWTNANESSLMGWLNVVQASLANASELIEFSQEIRDRGFKHIVLLGMGGSSLCARVLRKTFGIVYGFPELHVIDSTDPSQILRFAGELSQTVFIVSSKSGTTLETSLLQHYFQSQSRNLMAITDPDSQLDISARENNYMSVFSGVESIGGRFSALSNFGMVPAALMGVNIVRLLESAKQMFHACGPSVTETDNPGVSRSRTNLLC
jgi:transaldolase/glucose-6-phosphate isomerase